MGPELCCRPFPAAVEAGAGLHPDQVRREGLQAVKHLLRGPAFRQLQERGLDEATWLTPGTGAPRSPPPPDRT